jgi:hypothetical protein
MRATVILYSVTAGLPTLWQTVTKSPSRSQGGQGAGPSIFGTATRQSSHVTSHPGRMSNQPSVRNYFQRNWTNCRMLSKTAAQGSVPCVRKRPQKKLFRQRAEGRFFWIAARSCCGQENTVPDRFDRVRSLSEATRSCFSATFLIR